MSKKTAKKAATKTKTVTAPESKAAKPPKEKKEKAPREDRSSWKTFALRMPPGESAALHKAAGPANASKVMRALAGAFVTGDRAVFETIVEEARGQRA